MLGTYFLYETGIEIHTSLSCSAKAPSDLLAPQKTFYPILAPKFNPLIKSEYLSWLNICITTSNTEAGLLEVSAVYKGLDLFLTIATGKEQFTFLHYLAEHILAWIFSLATSKKLKRNTKRGSGCRGGANLTKPPSSFTFNFLYITTSRAKRCITCLTWVKMFSICLTQKLSQLMK